MGAIVSVPPLPWVPIRHRGVARAVLALYPPGLLLVIATAGGPHAERWILYGVVVGTGLGAVLSPWANSIRWRVATGIATGLSALTATLGTLAALLVLIPYDACPGTGSGTPLVAAATGLVVWPIAYLCVTGLVFRLRGEWMLLWPLAGLAAWLAVAVAFLALAALGVPHHCIT
jgi:hypothetical protein